MRYNLLHGSSASLRRRFCRRSSSLCNIGALQELRHVLGSLLPQQCTWWVLLLALAAPAARLDAAALWYLVLRPRDDRHLSACMRCTVQSLALSARVLPAQDVNTGTTWAF